MIELQTCPSCKAQSASSAFEYWVLAERGLDAKRIEPVLRAQMFRGK